MVESMPDESTSFDVPGDPAPFATRKEVIWRAALAQHVPVSTRLRSERGIEIEFRVRANGGYKPGDIDNLCEPVFSQLVNRAGWFGKRRTNIQWWHAIRRIDNDSGCTIRISNASIWTSHFPASAIQSVYSGLLPKHARDELVADWCRTSMGPPAVRVGTTAFGCAIEFSSSTNNIGDIATGRLKNLIDCLYPYWGGTVGHPDDHMIEELFVSKSSLAIPAGGVRITVWQR